MGRTARKPFRRPGLYFWLMVALVLLLAVGLLLLIWGAIHGAPPFPAEVLA